MIDLLDPLWMFRLPFSGSVAQRILSPAVTVNYAGDTAIEERVVADVASYGKQIGWLNELVLALVEDRQPEPDTVRRLAQAIKQIDDIKHRLKQSTLDGAIAALDRLRLEQPDEYRYLMTARMHQILAVPGRPDQPTLSAA